MSKAKLPYRSKRRDEPRFLLPKFSQEQINALFSGKPYVAPPIAPDELSFVVNGPGFTKMLRTATNFNRKKLNILYGKESRSLLHCLDDLWIIMSFYTWFIYRWPDARPSPVQSVLITSMLKSTFSLYACNRLTMDGLFGAGRPHLRHVFESLMIAKYCSVNPASDVYDRWVDGEDLYFANAILKKISKPAPDNFAMLWKHLCQWSHATVFALQVGLKIEEAPKETLVNLSLSGVFVQWMYHLINRHMVTPTVRYYGDEYTQSNEAEKARTRLKMAFQQHKKFLGPGSLRLVNDFRASWKLR